ncbi:Cornulin [Manis pentadactyla]|nr:Cornulin [Manis pentadactyla]
MVRVLNSGRRPKTSVTVLKREVKNYFSIFKMDLRTLSGLGAKCCYFTAATASQMSCGKQEGDSLLGQAPEELAANPAMLEAALQLSQSVTSLEFYLDDPW